MGIPITGATREAYDKTKTDAVAKPFPFIVGKWTNHTAEVVSVELAIDLIGNGSDQIVIKARNGEYESRIYVSLDPNQVGPNCTDVAEQVQKNIDRLLRVGKALEIITCKGSTPEIEPKLFKQAAGKIIEFGIQGAVDKYGQPKKNQKGYQTINTSFSGLTQALKPVVAPAAAQGQRSSSNTPPPPVSHGGYEDDIPF